MNKEALSQLSRRLNYVFKNQRFMQQALTHRSMGNVNNERLEFLGDSILNMVIAKALFEQFPKRSEGELSRLRASLVKGETLSQIAQELELGNVLILGQGELKSGGYRRASTLADALEALLAAIFLDAGFDVCEQIILSLYVSRLSNETLFDNIKDAKTELQEYLQSRKKPLPTYQLLKIVGKEHDQVFHILCTITDLNLSATGEAETRRKAEQIAAKILLQKLSAPRKSAGQMPV